MIKLIIFLFLMVIAGTVTFYFTIKRKIKCNNCKSGDVKETGKKQYKEDPVAFLGSPSSYEEIEYRCNNCGNLFWEKKGAAIFN